MVITRVSMLANRCGDGDADDAGDDGDDGKDGVAKGDFSLALFTLLPTLFPGYLKVLLTGDTVAGETWKRYATGSNISIA